MFSENLRERRGMHRQRRGLVHTARARSDFSLPRALWLKGVAEWTRSAGSPCVSRRTKTLRSTQIRVARAQRESADRPISTARRFNALDKATSLNLIPGSSVETLALQPTPTTQEDGSG
jgi:hypothetical protein